MAMTQMVLINEWLAYHVWMTKPVWPNVRFVTARLYRDNTYTMIILRKKSFFGCLKGIQIHVVVINIYSLTCPHLWGSFTSTANFFSRKYKFSSCFHWYSYGGKHRETQRNNWLMIGETFSLNLVKHLLVSCIWHLYMYPYKVYD